VKEDNCIRRNATEEKEKAGKNAAIVLENTAGSRSKKNTPPAQTRPAGGPEMQKRNGKTRKTVKRVAEGRGFEQVG